MGCFCKNICVCRAKIVPLQHYAQNYIFNNDIPVFSFLCDGADDTY
jgi:hypothetical protein